jgi:hypothetical protein
MVTTQSVQILILLTHRPVWESWSADTDEVPHTTARRNAFWKRKYVVLLAPAKGVAPYNTFFFNGAIAPSGSRPSQFWGSWITLRHNTLGRTPLDEWSAHRTTLYLTTHNTHKRRATMPPAGFGPLIPKRATADSRLRPRGHWDRNKTYLVWKK